jgi:uncharacterized membrane protein YkvA (DUF1232 family)
VKEMNMADREPVTFGSDRNLGTLVEIMRRLKLVWLLFFDSRVPVWAKAVLPLSLLYLISPIDFVPAAFVPILGGLDDLGVILLGMALLVKLSPSHVVEEYQYQLEYGRDAGDKDHEVVDATYRVVDEE